MYVLHTHTPTNMNTHLYPLLTTKPALALSRSDHLLSSCLLTVMIKHCYTYLSMIELIQVFRIVEFYHCWWEISLLCVLCEALRTAQLLSLHHSLSSLFLLALYKQALRLQKKRLWLLGVNLPLQKSVREKPKHCPASCWHIYWMNKTAFWSDRPSFSLMAASEHFYINTNTETAESDDHLKLLCIISQTIIHNKSE